MNNFGVIELAGAKTTAAPGWAYVPDTTVRRPSAPANRKRARNVPGMSIGDLTVRQETKKRKEAEALDRDGGRDNGIPLPGRAQGKHTPGVRKILQSQKTFGNHLDDFLALQALAESNPGAGSRSNGGGAGNKKSGSSRRDRDKDKEKDNTPSSARQDQDTQMTDANLPPVLPPSYKPPGQQRSEQDEAEVEAKAKTKTKADNQEGGGEEELLESRVPAMPTDEELRRLLAAPALSYGEATGNWEEKYPTRAFCEVCGYWGRVRCMKCGTRVCALDCLELHREECVTRYGL